MNAVEKRLKEIKKKIASLTSMREAGGSMRALVERLSLLEQQRVKKVDIREKQAGTCQIRIFDKSPSRIWNLQETIERGSDSN